MIEYNSYFGGLLAQLAAAANAPRGLLRAQDEAGVAAVYAFAAAGGGLWHASLNLTNYAHCSSPIRRYADLHNQHALFESFDPSCRTGVLGDDSLQVPRSGLKGLGRGA